MLKHWQARVLHVFSKVCSKRTFHSKEASNKRFARKLEFAIMHARSHLTSLLRCRHYRIKPHEAQTWHHVNSQLGKYTYTYTQIHI